MEASDLPPSSARFISNRIDCSPLNVIHASTHTLQTSDRKVILYINISSMPMYEVVSSK